MKKTLNKSSVTMLAASIMAQAAPVTIAKATAVTGAAVLAMSLTQNAHAQDSGRSVLELAVSKKVKEPVIFHIKGTNNIVLDVYGVDREFKGMPEVQNDPLVEKVVTKIVGDRLRVVIQTKKEVKFQATQVEGRVLVQFDASDKYENVTPASAVAVAKQDLNGISGEWKEGNSRLPSITEAERDALVAKYKASKNQVQGGVAVTAGPAVEPVSAQTQEVVQTEAALPTYTNFVTKENAFIELQKINLKKDGKATKVVFDLSSGHTVPNVKKEGNKLIVELNGVSIPNELQRRVATDTLGTNVKVLDVSMQKNQGRLILEVADEWDYSFYQADNQFAVSVKAIDKAEQVKKYSGKPLTISFQDIDVRAVLQVIADFTNLNIMSSDQITGSMTLRLKDVPWDQALDLVLESRGLQKVVEGNVIRIATNEEVEKSNEAKLKLKSQNESLEALKLEFFQVNYYKAEELKAVLEGKVKGESTSENDKITLLSDRGTVGVDSRNNILLVQDTEASLQYIRNIIKKLDIPTRQVLIEAKIVIAEDAFGKELGSKFGIRGYKKDGRHGLGLGNSLENSGDLAQGGAVGTTTGIVSSLAAAAVNGFAPGAIGFTLLNLGNGNALGFELSALEANQRGKVLSSPRLLTTDNRKALIEQGTEIPYVTPSSGDSPPTVSFKKAVLKLEVTPQITPNGRVIMDLEIRKDTIGQLVNVQGGGQVPSIDTRNMQNQITVANGQTVVLGGVYEVSSRDDVAKIPFFGDIPGIGNLFKNKSKSEEKGELLIFITPHIIEDEDLDADVTSNEITLEKK